MARKRYTAEQIISYLRQAEILISEGKTIIEAACHLDVSEQTYYRWRKEYGGVKVAQVHRRVVRRYPTPLSERPVPTQSDQGVSRCPFFHLSFLSAAPLVKHKRVLPSDELAGQRIASAVLSGANHRYIVFGFN